MRVILSTCERQRRRRRGLKAVPPLKSSSLGAVPRGSKTNCHGVSEPGVQGCPTFQAFLTKRLPGARLQDCSTAIKRIHNSKQPAAPRGRRSRYVSAGGTSRLAASTASGSEGGPPSLVSIRPLSPCPSRSSRVSSNWNLLGAGPASTSSGLRPSSSLA